MWHDARSTIKQIQIKEQRREQWSMTPGTLWKDRGARSSWTFRVPSSKTDPYGAWRRRERFVLQRELLLLLRYHHQRCQMSHCHCWRILRGRIPYSRRRWCIWNAYHQMQNTKNRHETRKEKKKRKRTRIRSRQHQHSTICRPSRLLMANWPIPSLLYHFSNPSRVN